MDMVTKIEIEDAVKVTSKLTARVKHVAEAVGKIRGEFLLERENQPGWRMDSFTVNNAKPAKGMEHLLELGVRTNWSTYVGDEEDRHRVTRTIQFPTWYLTENGWEDREARKARNHKRVMARLQLDAMKQALSDAIEHHAGMMKKLAAMTKLANESDEVIDG